MRRATAVSSILVLALALTSGASSAQAQTQSPSTPSGRILLDDFLQQVTTFRSDFEQVLMDEDNVELESTGGQFYLQRPNRFRWNYDEPLAQEIVGDGERVWFYDRDLEQVTVKAFDQTLGDTPVLLLSSQGRLDESFEVYDLGWHDDLVWVSLVPKSEQNNFTEIRVGFENRSLRKMRLVDSFGQRTTLTFLEAQINSPLDPGLFRFEPPEGADVIGPADL